MTSAYIENKDYSELKRGFVVPFGKHEVHVYIWSNVKGLRRNTYFEPADHDGAYVYYPYRKPRSGLFGEIHLLASRIGADYVAHEIQHLLFDWLMTQTIKAGTNEKIATLAGEFTAAFWSEYYE